MSTFNDYNQTVIAQFRANGGNIEGRPLLLLTTTGARSGQPRTTPLAYTLDGDSIVIIASKAGAPTNPDWYHNLLANPTVTVEMGGERFQAQAALAPQQDRDRLYAQMVEHLPQFAEYQRKTSRQIPVVVLKRVA